MTATGAIAVLAVGTLAVDARIGLAAFVLSYAFVGWVRRYALAAKLLDVPNERSSHAAPTPRGGGLGLIGALALVVGVFGPRLAERGTASVALILVPTLAVAAVGWLDDRRSLPVLPRLTTHVAAGLVVGLVALGVSRAPGLQAGVGAGLWFGWWAFATVAAINVVNFMDGIDGLVAGTIAVFGAHLALHAPAGSIAAALAVALASTCAGFLVWNWAPAKIFLGDVGSGALGVAAVCAGLLASPAFALGGVDAFLPLLPLCADAALTMARRARRGERLTTAHRSHLYQRLANGGWGHAAVSALYGVAAAAGALVAALPLSSRGALAAVRVGYAVAVVGAGLWLDRTAVPRPPPDRRA